LYGDDPDSVLILPIFDYQSGFVQMHPLEWTVNRLVFKNHFGWDCYIGIPCLLLSHKADSTFASKRDLTDLLTKDTRPLYSNVFVPPSNSWSQILHNVYFHYTTGFAVLSMIDQTQPLAYSQNDAARGLLAYIGNLNRRMGCASSNKQRSTPFEVYTYPFHDILNTQQQQQQQQQQQESTNDPQRPPHCWIPIIIVYGADSYAMSDLINGLDEFEYPPAVIVDIQAYDTEPFYEKPMLISNTTWVVSYFIEAARFDMLRMDLTVPTTPTSSSSSEQERPGQPVIPNMELIQDSMSPVAQYVKDEKFYTDFEFTSNLVKEALDNDPVIATMDQPMPLASKPPDVYHCFAGECPIGNLFTDAARWKSQADIAIINAGGVRGPGWDAGTLFGRLFGL
jgi:hypothetical protein